MNAPMRTGLTYGAVAGLSCLLALVLVGACEKASNTQSPAPVATVTTQDEHSEPDCDLDDMIEGDSDCYGRRPSSAAPAPRKTSAKPRPSKIVSAAPALAPASPKAVVKDAPKTSSNKKGTTSARRR